MMKRVWWKEEIGYQIYPRSFKDSNQDGIGDINGIREKIPYLKELGVDFLWLNPIYQSPNVDNGYDISDYQKIQPEFGTMADFDLLLAEAHNHGLKVIMDLVINHTSDQHYWFQEAKKSMDNPYRDYYIWREGVEGALPNNWQSIFGGSVWEFDQQTNEYYFHAFAKEQPDLNWESPALKQEIFDMIRWWLDKGIDGFRVDAISHIKKEPFDLPADSENPSQRYQNITGIDSYLKELQQVFAEYEIMTVGEANGVSADEGILWAGDDGYFNMIFEFEHIRLWRQSKDEGFDVPAFKSALSRWQQSLDGKGWNALYMENHDIPRSVSVAGDDTSAYREISAKALAISYMLLQGTPFIYQGQELGMTNMAFNDISEIDVVDSKNLYQELLAKGTSAAEALEIVAETTRDNARTPMQWSNDEFAGFSEGTPWLKVNPNKENINVAKEMADENSVYHFYKKLIQLRKQHETLIYGTYQEILAENQQIFAYKRISETAEFLIVSNLSKMPADFSLASEIATNNWQRLLSSYPEESTNKGELRPFEANVYYKKIKS
ncbi:alpha-glucosidase [Enterococcus sp. PF1-24]|uniref:glycoside hydrolase family 13 protein n=1 Tax=unclassified Enterococcus TaxID=2608891 RepID=UPI0024738188|nr:MULTISPECIES: alpha-glucosidase [unclassified Enterococcus]MDH6363822.1 alpha-glucosidase [Enterococcus sp. PFB1-1]MDH6400992.1 alpha-glucosidase [Enterococcus sp. PF1-24]